MNQLKEAEKKATVLVEEARKGKNLKFFRRTSMFMIIYFICYYFAARVDRMKEAKTEAEQILSVSKIISIFKITIGPVKRFMFVLAVFYIEYIS